MVFGALEMIIVLFLLLMVAVVGLIVFFVIKKASHIKKNGVHVTGLVTGYEERENLNGTGKNYYPTVKFQTHEGREIEASLAIGSAKKPYQTGGTIKVVYDPANPSFVTLP